MLVSRFHFKCPFYFKFIKIVLPTGAVVMVMNGRKRTSQFINIKLKASSADYGSTEGRVARVHDKMPNAAVD